MKSGISLAACLALLLLPLFGCRDREAPALHASARRDSTGVLIIQSSAPAWPDNTGWTVDPDPILSLGVAEGDSAQVFTRLAGAVRRDDGNIIVSDGGSHQLRLFSPDGKLLRVAGRAGTGPGEMRTPLELGMCADELWVLDFPPRVLVWTRELEFVRSFTLSDLPMWPMMCFGGRVLLKDDVVTDEPQNSLFTSSLDLRLAMTTTNGAATPVTRIPLHEYIVVVTGSYGGGFVHPFGRRTHLGRVKDGIAMTGFHDTDIRVIGLDGALRRIVRGPAQDLSVSRSMLDRYREVTLDDREATWRGALASIGMPMPPGRPAYTDLVIDSDENFWAKRFAPPGDTATGWAVFAASGELLGDVAIPPAKRIFAIGHDFILAHVVDSLDVDKIAVFRLLKAAGRDSAGK